jgi:phosphoglycerol geranylgeranyltransferase
MAGRVEKYLCDKIEQEGVIQLTLIDPEEVDVKSAVKIATYVESSGSAAILLGGSTAVSTFHLDSIVREIKANVKIPVILFPNNIAGISRYADAIFFMSLLNSSNPYYITGAQALGAPIVKKYGLEPISLGYIIVGEGGSAGFIGQAHPIPFEKPELAAIYALAAQYLGMHFAYLEAGSGAKKPVPPKMIRTVKESLGVPLIVGGGVKSSREAVAAANAGADIIVTGTIVEEASLRKVRELIQSLRKLKPKSQRWKAPRG